MVARVGRTAARRGVDADALLDEVRSASALGRLATADEVAWCVARLTDPEASVLSGSVLFADAGARQEIP
jgi:enoyl-[acyl-carrier-protein] reductase (NADH)